MGELQLYEEIINAKSNSNILLDLVTKFTPLLKKYATLLAYEDAYSDLQLDFIELIYKFKTGNMKRTNNGAMLSYIKKAVHNNYINRSKKLSEYCFNNYFFSEMSDEQFAAISIYFSTTDNYDTLDLVAYQKYLTNQEFETILMIYYYGYEVSEISRLKHVSRQAINQVKVRSLSKLRKQLTDTVI